MDEQRKKSKFPSTFCTFPERSLQQVPTTSNDLLRQSPSSSWDKDSNDRSNNSPTKEFSLKETQSSRHLLGCAMSAKPERPMKEVLDIHGVRIRPAVVCFRNTFENQVYNETVSVQNISDSSVSVWIHNPRAWSFRISSMDRSYMLAPGLKISRHLTYTCTKNGIVHSSLPIYVNDNTIELPLEAYKGQAFVEIIPTSIMFGRVDLGCKPVERKILIRNVSMCATKFSVDIGPNLLDFQVCPMKGWIRPHSSMNIKLKLLVLREGVHTAELWITTNLCQTRVQVEVEAYRPNLMVLHPNTISDFTLIHFPLTFSGCRRYQTIDVCNVASSSSAFVVLADFGNKGLQPFKEAQEGEEQNVKMFDIDPVEGRIKPFEERIFTIWFNPTITNISEKSENNGDAKDFLCAVRIKRIYFDDFGANYSKGAETRDDAMSAFLENSHSSNSNVEGEMNVEMEDAEESLTGPVIEEVSVLLYLYGEAEVPSLSAIPDALYFPQTLVGETVVKVVQLKNNSSQSLAFRYSKIPFFDVLPVFKKIAPKAAYDVTVKLCARNIGSLNRNLTFEVLVQSNSTDKLDFHVVSQVTVKIVGEVKSQKRVPVPRFNPGITPLITHEVGILTDEVTFTSKIEKPRCAITALAQRGRPWHLPDATIAFPNDRPLTLRPRPTDATAKTIYKGLARYIAPVDKSMTYTREELIRKKAHENWFLKYIRGTAAISVTKGSCCKWKTPEPEPPVVFEDKQPELPREVFVPLTFVQLYRIKVYPPVISFGCVIKSKKCSQLLSVENSNSFKICARIRPLTSVIKVQTTENFIISQNSEAKVMLTFQREILGKYSGTITCIINGYHEFDIAVVAEVAHRSLTVKPDNLAIRIPESPFANTFAPVAINNPLNIPVTFSWVIPDESPVKIEPTIGVIPERGTVWSVAYFEPENPNYKLSPMKLTVEGNTCFKLKTGIILPKTNVYFLGSVLDLGYIPMNITTIKEIIFFNPDFSAAMFVVLNKEPVKGIQVKPSSGTIRPRSCHTLTLHMALGSIKSLDFTIYMTIQNSASIEVKVTGTVVHPQVEFTPHYINLQRVPCNSVTRTTLMAENKSKARANVSFDMDEYPQFKVSLSRRLHNPGVPKHGFTLDPESSQKFYLYFIPKHLASYDFYLPVKINYLNLQHHFPEIDIEEQCRLIRSQNRRSLCSDTRRFSKPRTKSNSIMSHLVFIDVVVLKAPLVVSESEIFFSSTSESKSFTIKNISEQSIDIITRCEDYQSPFDFEIDTEEAAFDRISGKLSIVPGGMTKITSTFGATSPGSYTADLSILASFDDHSCVYTTVRMTGHIVFPCVITSSVSEVYFEPVPLNVDTSFIFNLKISRNQEIETVIVHKMVDPNTDLFIVEYPEGNRIAGIKTSIPVKITFRSHLPISVKKQVTFKGSESSECSITMVATADNCIVTTYSFLKRHPPSKLRLEDLEESREKLSLMGSGIIEPPTQSVIRDIQASHPRSFSNGSNKSKFSMQTICSLSSATCRRKTITTIPNLRQSVVAQKERKLHSDSDIDITYNLSEKEEGLSPTNNPTVEMKEIITKEDEEMGFPIFPVESAESEDTVYMNKILKSVQQWVYEQVFCCSYNPFFGSHAFSSFSLLTKKDYGQSSTVVLKNVFDVLERICGRRIRRFFTPINKLPEDKIAKAVFTHNLYQQLVDFMVAQGALMAHVEPKYLMVYEEYCSYHKATSRFYSDMPEQENMECQIDDLSSSELMTAERFHRISVQCWLDLFLQIFKTLVLGPAVGINYNSLHEGSKMHNQFSHDSEEKKSLYGRAEEILLTWLTNQYNAQRTILWPKKPPPPRVVSNFDTDLEDGLVLTTTTAAYCPHLNQIDFGVMFLKATTISQAYHNATCLCMAWDSVKLGFSITPRDFVQRCPINMLLLVTHLYKVLPSYKPEATITFKAILNASDSQIITLENNEEVNVTYHVEILPHNTNFILGNCENPLVLKHNSKVQITVQYLARNTNKAEAILLLCGACMPSKFGRNYVFKLEGYPFKLPVSSAFNIIAPQNTPMTTTISVVTPHLLDFDAKESYLYNLWVAYTEPQPESLNAVCWAKERRHKLPRRLFFPENTLVVKLTKNRTGSGELTLKVCCFSQVTSDFWLIFRNEEIGDFIVKLQISPRRPDPVMNLLAMMSTDSKCSCISDRSFNCNRCTTVKVPCRNLEQWAAVMTMFELTISPAEKQFWATYMESNVGFRLLLWMLEEKKEKLGQELELLFKKSKVYKVSCPSKHISCVPTLEIPDVRSKSFLPLQLHFDENTPNLSTTLNLTSTDGKEKRSYNLKVVINGSK